MKILSIRGKAKFINLETGFWGIIADDGSEYRPVNMPDQLKYDGARVRCKAQLLDDDFSIHMWGQAVRVIGFHTTVDLD